MADEIKLVELEDGWVTHVVDADATRAVRTQEVIWVGVMLTSTALASVAGGFLAAALGGDPLLGGVAGSLIGLLAAAPVASRNAPAGWRIAASHRGLGLRRVYGRNAGSVPHLREDRPSRASLVSPWEAERLIPWMDLEQVRATDVSLILTLEGGERIELACEDVPRADIARLANTIEEIQQRYQGKGASAEQAEAARRDLEQLKQSQAQRES